MGRRRLLSDEQCEAIRASEKSVPQLCQEYGVSYATIYKVKNHKYFNKEEPNENPAV